MSSNELTCKYVGSRALLNSCTRKSPNPRSDSSYLDTTVYKDILNKDCILHVCPQAIPAFVQNVLPTLMKPFILLTNNSDWTIPDDIHKEADILLNHPLLTHWFAQNCIVDHPKLTRIPIGLDYHSLIPRKKQFIWSLPETHSWGVKMNPLQQEYELLTIANQALPFYQRKLKAYANFHFLMTTRYGKFDRTYAYNTIPKDLVYYEPIKCQRTDSWKRMTEYAFVISPHGNGLDCHRTWESLCLGCIPIVKTSGLDPLFKDLPVWIVKLWSDVTEDNMKYIISLFQKQVFNMEKLTLRYWRDLMFNSSNYI